MHTRFVPERIPCRDGSFAEEGSLQRRVACRGGFLAEEGGLLVQGRVPFKEDISYLAEEGSFCREEDPFSKEGFPMQRRILFQKRRVPCAEGVRLALSVHSPAGNKQKLRIDSRIQRSQVWWVVPRIFVLASSTSKRECNSRSHNGGARSYRVVRP